MPTTIVTNPVKVYVGSRVEFQTTCYIDGGGSGRTFTFRVGAKGTKNPYLKLSMTKSSDTGSSVDLSVAISPTNTALIKNNTDFQICLDNPEAVLMEGKIVLDQSIGTL